jgi:hypothetical protein
MKESNYSRSKYLERRDKEATDNNTSTLAGDNHYADVLATTSVIWLDEDDWISSEKNKNSGTRSGRSRDFLQ